MYDVKTDNGFLSFIQNLFVFCMNMVLKRDRGRRYKIEEIKSQPKLRNGIINNI
jgi:hypothetical protein